MQSVINAQDFSCWCSLGQSSGTDGGVRSQNEGTGLDEDEKLAELISVATRKRLEEALVWWRSFGEPGDYSVFIRRDVASDKLTDVTSVIYFPLRCL